MEAATLLPVMAATALNSAMPGPCMILIAARTAQGGGRSGLFASLGIAVAQLLYALVALALLTLALNLPEAVQTAIRLGGALVLLVLAMRMLAPARPAENKASGGLQAHGDMAMGIAVGLSSPFNLVFMFSVLPQFVSGATLLDPSIAVVLLAIFLATMGPMLVTIWAANGARSLAGRFVPLLVRSGAVVLMGFAVLSIASVA